MFSCLAIAVAMTSRQTALSQWNELNPRQQKYLALIYRVDQASEKDAKQGWFRGEERRPASEWRWLFYGELNFTESRLKSLLRAAGYVDPGTGSTFKALARRGLIECAGEVPALTIKMTKLGRRIVRVGMNMPTARRTRTPKGMLSQKAWCALTLAYQKREEGLASGPNDPYHYCQGIHTSVWERLINHNPPLVARPKSYRPTACGTLFYLRHYQRYREVYPEIDAPIPPETEAEIISQLKAPDGDKSALARVKRWHRGLKEASAEVKDASPSELHRFEKGQSVQPEQRERILNWLRR